MLIWKQKVILIDLASVSWHQSPLLSQVQVCFTMEALSFYPHFLPNPAGDLSLWCCRGDHCVGLSYLTSSPPGKPVLSQSTNVALCFTKRATRVSLRYQGYGLFIFIFCTLVYFSGSFTMQFYF